MEIESLEHVASIIGEPARIKMLWALMDGRAYTAKELSVISEVSPQSASMHLSKLVHADLLRVTAQGRHRYYSYAKEEVAYAIEALAGLIPPEKTIIAQKTSDSPFRYCRSCYDHLAGKAGVAITDSIIKNGYMVQKELIYEITGNGHAFFSDLGIDTVMLATYKRPLAKPCLDWSERRFHLAGSLGAGILDKMINEQWIRRVSDSRTLVITANGKSSLYNKLGLNV